MSDGAYLLTRIRNSCHEDGDCLIWDGYCNDAMPVMNIGRSPRPVRRVVFENAIGPIRKGFEVIGTCGTRKCVAPEHLKQILKAARRAMLGAARAGLGASPKQVRFMRENFGKLDLAKAREIRSSDETGVVLAARFGVSPQLISMVKQGKSWAEPSPFAGLGQRRSQLVTRGAAHA